MDAWPDRRHGKTEAWPSFTPESPNYARGKWLDDNSGTDCGGRPTLAADSRALSGQIRQPGPGTMGKLGPYALHALETGHLSLDGGAMFGIVPRTLWQRRLVPDERGRVRLAMRCLLLEGAGRLILIDNGVGDKLDARFRDWFAIEGEERNLDRALASAGFAPADVTDVVLTHLHFDHAGGSTVRTPSGLAPRFANALYHVQHRQLASARKPNEREAASFLPENFEPLAAAGQLRSLDGACQLFEGIDTLTVDGHTDAQQLVRIRSEKNTLVFVADLLPTVHHVSLPWIMAYDVRPLATLREKKSFLAEAARHRYQLFFEHDPDVCVASVAETERGWKATDVRPLLELR